MRGLLNYITSRAPLRLSFKLFGHKERDAEWKKVSKKCAFSSANHWGAPEYFMDHFTCCICVCHGEPSLVFRSTTFQNYWCRISLFFCYLYNLGPWKKACRNKLHFEYIQSSIWYVCIPECIVKGKKRISNLAQFVVGVLMRLIFHISLNQLQKELKNRHIEGVTNKSQFSKQRTVFSTISTS